MDRVMLKIAWYTVAKPIEAPRHRSSNLLKKGRVSFSLSFDICGPSRQPSRVEILSPGTEHTLARVSRYFLPPAKDGVLHSLVSGNFMLLEHNTFKFRQCAELLVVHDIRVAVADVPECAAEVEYPALDGPRGLRRDPERGRDAVAGPVELRVDLDGGQDQILEPVVGAAPHDARLFEQKLECVGEAVQLEPRPRDAAWWKIL